MSRLKQPQSNLQKMWQKAEYTNKDAIRDSGGVAIIYPDDASQEEKEDIAQLITSFFPDMGYYFDNKNCFGDIGQLVGSLQKKPLIIDSKNCITSSKEFESFSVSGFLKIHTKHMGWEFQCMSESVKQWKDKDDAYYKIRSAIDAWVRGPKYTTLPDLYNLLNTRAGSALDLLEISTIKDLIYDMIREGYLIPYLSRDEKHIVFSVKGKEKHFEHGFSFMDRITNITIPSQEKNIKGGPPILIDYITEYCSKMRGKQ